MSMTNFRSCTTLNTGMELVEVQLGGASSLEEIQRQIDAT